MTESEWNVCADPDRMLGFLDACYGTLSPRKLRTFAYHCCRNVLRSETEPGIREAVGYLERFAHEGGSEELARKAASLAHAMYREYFGNNSVCNAVYGVAHYFLHNPRAAARAAVLHCGTAAERKGGTGALAAEQAFQAAWLRDIFPSPFRPVVPGEAWRTDTAVLLAKGMYESRDFSAMPILADSLQDAGCDNPDVLGHCRDETLAHVRGCWVVDLVLGKA